MKSINFGLGQITREKPAQSQAPVLGERELDVMKILWRHGTLSAQGVLQHSAAPAPSLSTLQSTLECLYRKQLLARHETGRSYYYRATVSRSAIIGQLIGDIAEHFGEGDMAPMISGFMSFMHREGDAAQTLPPSMRQAIQTFREQDDD